MSRLTGNRSEPTFSAKMKIDTIPIHARLIAPTTNRTSMKSQQHPMQYIAWRDPMRTAPARPDRQWCMTKPMGDSQWLRHTSFGRVNW